MRALGLLLLVSGCASGDDARIRIDVSDLWQQSAQSVDTITVRVFDGTDLLISDILTSTSDQADLEVMAGDLRFEVEALTAAAAPSFFGEHTQSIPPGEDWIDVPVAVFPAGGIDVTVTVTDGTPIPADAIVVTTANNPRSDPDAPNDRQLPIVGGVASGPLLDGSTTLTIEFTAGGTPYSGSTTVTVIREQIDSVTIAVAP